MPFKRTRANSFIVRRHRTLALQHLNFNTGLERRCRAKYLRENVTGSVVLRSTKRVATPPTVSMDKDSGVTSSSNKLFACTMPEEGDEGVSP